MNNNCFMSPYTASILLTYRCTAACDECCFSCSPKSPKSLISFDEIKKFIDQIIKIPSIKIVVFSGGECFLEYELLKNSIKYAHDLGLLTRCVTNGFWGKSFNLAQKKMNELCECGLDEINFSTGDSHQKFVPLQNILNCVRASIDNSLSVCVSVETNKSKNFKVDDFLTHEYYLTYIKNSPNISNLKLIPATWVSFHTDTVYQFDESVISHGENVGCTGIFDTIVLDAQKNIIGCCGLTSKDIKEFQLGSIENVDLQVVLDKHVKDFLKIWIFVDGPQKIVTTVSNWLGIPSPTYAHKCLYCAYLYNNKDILKEIKNKYKDIQEDIVLRYFQKSFIVKSLNNEI